ncbi:MAG: response regulator, partial [Dehalococcoidia bacterium]
MQASVSAGIELAAELSLEALLQKIVDIARQVVKAKYAALGVVGEEGGLSQLITSGVDEETRAKIGRLPAGRGLLGVILDEAQPLRLRDLTQDPRSVGFPAHHPPMRSFLGVPIMSEGRVFGNLYLTEKLGAEEFSEEDEVLATSLASQAALAIENARLYESVAKERERLQGLAGRLLDTQEEERRRVAYDIHDGLGQLITAAGMHLEAFRGDRTQVEANEVEEELGKGSRCLQDAIAEMRRIVSELRPSLLEDLGLTEAARHYLEEMGSRMGWQVQFQEEISGLRLEPVVETALFRIVQEALANAGKHAKAERVRISLNKEDDQLVLEIRDWGAGFDVERVLAQSARGEHVGLLSMRERAQLVGATCSIKSAVGQGTTVTVRVPLANQVEREAKAEEGVWGMAKEKPAIQAPGKGPITVLVADDHPMVREGLRSMLNARDVRVVGEAATGAEAVEQVGNLQPSVVLMDVRMPDMDGLTATEIVKREWPGTSVIIITSYESRDYLRRAIEVGAAGYILKGMSRESLLNATKVVKEGGSLIEARLLSELLTEMGVEGTRYAGGLAGTIEALSPREQQVLQLLVRGLTNKEIAAEMHYSVGT